MNQISGKPIPKMSKELSKEFFSLGILMGMSKKQMMRALNMYYKIAHHPMWDSRRTSRALSIDCLYEVQRVEGMGMTQKDITEFSHDAFGKSTQPKPHLWRDFYVAII